MRARRRRARRKGRSPRRARPRSIHSDLARKPRYPRAHVSRSAAPRRALPLCLRRAASARVRRNAAFGFPRRAYACCDRFIEGYGRVRRARARKRRAPASAAPSSGSFTKLSAADELRFVTPHLAGKKLAHPAFRGPFGPPGDNIVALTSTGEALPAELAGFVVLADGRVLPLPKLHDQWTLWELHAILFEDADGDGAKDLIVIAEYVTGIGPTGAVPFFANAVVRWDGKAFVRVPSVEKRIESLEDAAAIRKALRKSK
ncbi:Hypothetical protein A7982_06743 [Minicystis rosea]|nr:Hypothetical protein A7982_06743 [Minicystis rosea]